MNLQKIIYKIYIQTLYTKYTLTLIFLHHIPNNRPD